MPEVARLSTRRAAIGDAAITVLATRGMRGLTHRAVDAVAALPAGSTSYYARTRAALLDLVVARLVELDDADDAAAGAIRTIDGADALAEIVAWRLARLLTSGRTRTLARYELALEATRRPELRAGYDRAGAVIRRQAAVVLAATGSTAPARHARMLTAWCDGVLFDALAGAGGIPSTADLRDATNELLRGMLG